jgi:hypothetical protein
MTFDSAKSTGETIGYYHAMCGVYKSRSELTKEVIDQMVKESDGKYTGYIADTRSKEEWWYNEFRKAYLRAQSEAAYGEDETSDDE